MGNKDFTDWNGRKRKADLFPPKEKGVRAKPATEKKPGFKTKCDRYMAAIKEFRFWWKYREEKRRRRRDTPRGKWSSYGCSWKHCFSGADTKKIRKIEDAYRAEGILNKVREQIGLKPK